jgi:hypothetical protein
MMQAIPSRSQLTGTAKPDGPESYYTKNNESIRKVSGQWVQYRAVFDMNNGADTPILKSVEITFDK